MEEYLYDWCLYEYLQMKEYLKNTPCNLIISNSVAIYNYEGKHTDENKKNLSKLVEEF